ncbi:uncharacterized protein LOC106772620 isoform X2 [Vigna radiata var. radiata]|uniref:Uncharacterized protein LOC106772620 isoform X2 n=1 Tax=Vigna radiata var. radiata TaxID=3916 RepID=A0A3Q0FG17_VIGRR|nr:uncharacterized protein LOC106772620 isoform X2 [Vigna radiata var. radiata]
MAMSAALSLSQFPVSGYISFPKRRLPSRSFYIRAMSETSSSTSVSSQNEGPTTDYSSASSVTIAPPPNFKPPEPKRFAIRPDKIGDVLGAALPFLLRFATGVFVSGYSVSVVSKDEIPPDQYALELNGITIKETSKLGPRPEKYIEIYEFERLEKLLLFWTLMLFSILVQEMVQISVQRFFRWVVNCNSPTWLIQTQVFQCDGNVPLSLSLGFLTTLTAGLGMLSRIGKGTTYTPAKFPPKPLKLWAYEVSPFCKIVREVLVELELPHLLVSCARGSPKRHILYQKTGHFQIPYLEDPNTGIEMFESAEIIEYLRATYALQ